LGWGHGNGEPFVWKELLISSGVGVQRKSLKKGILICLEPFSSQMAIQVRFPKKKKKKIEVGTLYNNKQLLLFPMR
jgi:hypothetical protein